MTATTRRRPAAAPHAAGLAGSFALHAALFVVAASTTTAFVASARSAPDPERPLAVAWTRAAAGADDVVAPAPSIEPAPSIDFAPEPEPLTVCDVEAGERLGGACVPPESTDATCEIPAPDLRHAFAARVPGRGRAAGSGATSLGAGGFGGRGGDDVGAAVGFGGTDASFGRCDGDGVESGGPRPRGGATRGPSVVSALSVPMYPSMARSRGWEGRVVLLLSIDERGRVVAVDVAELSGRSALDDAARDAASAWTFAPALRDDAPVAGTLRVPVRFELTD